MSQAIAVKGSLQESQKKRDVTFAEAFLTVEAICVVDISASMGVADVGVEGLRSRWDEANQQLAKLQARFPGKLAVVAFSDYAQFCPSGVLPFIQSSTNMLGALQFVAPADGVGIKFIMVSDGSPDDPQGTLAYASQMQSPIDAIYIGTDPGGKEFMEKLAAATRGRSITKGVSLLEESVVRLLRS